MSHAPGSSGGASGAGGQAPPSPPTAVPVAVQAAAAGYYKYPASSPASSNNLSQYQQQRLQMEMTQLSVKHKELYARVTFCVDSVRRILDRLNIPYIDPDSEVAAKSLSQASSNNAGAGAGVSASGEGSRKANESAEDDGGGGGGEGGAGGDDGEAGDEGVPLMEAMDDYGDMGGGKRKRARGKLPDWATTALTQWLLDHKDRPYPSEEEKAKLVSLTGLTIVQVNNWFSNARRRQLKRGKAAQAAAVVPVPSPPGSQIDSLQKLLDDPSKSNKLNSMQSPSQYAPFSGGMSLLSSIGSPLSLPPGMSLQSQTPLQASQHAQLQSQASGSLSSSNPSMPP